MNFNDFEGFNISPKTEINTFGSKNFPGKVATFKNQQIININNNKRKLIFQFTIFIMDMINFLVKWKKIL